MKVVLRVSAFLLKLSLGLFAIAVPLLGAWIGSSLAAFLNGPRWVAPVAAFLAFPILPLLWEGVARRRRGEKKSILTFVDRMILRTLLVNLVFVGGFLFFSPKTVFTALSARADWMLDDLEEGEGVASVRRTLFAGVDGLEWVFGESVSGNQFEELVDDDQAPAPDLRDSIDERDASDVPPSPAPNPAPNPAPGVQPDPSGPDAQRPDAQDATNDDSGQNPPSTLPQRAAPDELWPFDHSVHPAIAQISPSAESSIEALARHVVSVEANPVQRFKALHDWVAQNVRYDVGLLRAIERGEAPNFDSQQAESVFRQRAGVCAGYANLLKALGDAADIEVLVVVGHTRSSAELGGVGHAWNAVKLKERWYLVDATWDAGYVNGDSFTPQYSADYFLTPARAFVLNHFPDEEDWQLMAQPISRAEFMRQPNLRPSFFERGLSLRAPDRSQVTVSGDVSVQLDNPHRHWVMVTIEPKEGGGEPTQCGVANDSNLSLRCSLSGSGFYTLRVLLGEDHYGQYQGAGEIEVVRR